MTYFEDRNFIDRLLVLITKDRKFLTDCADLLSPQDFRPKRSQVIERWVVASIALDFWNKYREPVGMMLTSEIGSYAKKANLSQVRLKELQGYAEGILKTRAVAAESIQEKVIEYKR